MYYYSLEKYYKKNEPANLASPTESLRKVLSPSDILPGDPELNVPRSRKEKSGISTGVNKDLFKRIRVINPDLSEALEVVFSYQFSLNGFTLELVKMFEKVAHTLNNIAKPSGPDNIGGPHKQSKPSGILTSPSSSKLIKSPLEMEINSILFNAQKLHEELFSLITDIIPKKEKSLSRGKQARPSNTASNEWSPSKKRPSAPIIAETKGLNKSQISSQKSPKIPQPKMKVNFQRLYEQDQKENNNEALHVSNESHSSRFLNLHNNSNLSQLKVSASRNFPSSTRNNSHKDSRILNKRGINLSNGPSESASNILSELKNESKRQISDKLSGKIELDILPQKELDDDETNSQWSLPTSEAIPTLANQKSQSENTFSKVFMVKTRDDMDIIKKEKNVVKHLFAVQNNFSNTAKKNDQTPLCQKRYLIDAKWWTAWKEYVNFDSNTVDENKCLTQVYPRPGKIRNQDLINQEHIKKDVCDTSNIGLKEHLLEHHDFEAVSKEIFEILAAWYGCDYEIIRLLRPDPSHPDKFFLDLFPKRRIKKASQQKSMPDNLPIKK